MSGFPDFDIKSAMEKVNILIVDDEVLMRDGMKSLLAKEDFVKNIVEADSVESFNEKLSTSAIHIILLDIRLQKTSGMELLSVLKQHKVQPKVIVVTGLEGVELMINLLKAGVDGIVFKLDGYQEIIKTIKSVLNNENYFPEKILKIIQVNSHRWDEVPPVVLTFQEKELLRCIAGGMTTKEMAQTLKMTEATAETYRVRLIKKVGLPNTASLLAYSYRNGIL